MKIMSTRFDKGKQLAQMQSIGSFVLHLTTTIVKKTRVLTGYCKNRLKFKPLSSQQNNTPAATYKYLVFFQNLKTGQKIYALIIMMAVFLSVVGAAGYYYTGKMSGQLQVVTANNLLSVKWLNEIRVNINTTEAAVTRIVNPLTIDKFLIDEKISEIKKHDESIERQLSNYQQITLSSFEKQRASALETELSLYKEEVQKVLNLVQAGKKPEAYSFFTLNAKPHLDASNALLMELAEYSSKQAEDISSQSQTDTIIAKTTVLAASLIAILISLILGVLLSRFTARRLVTVGVALNEVAEGNLQFNDLKISARDDIGAIAQDVNKMVINLRTMVDQVAQSAEQVASSSEELTAIAEQSSQTVNQVSSAMNEVADGTREQLKAVDQTSASIDQMTAKLQQIAAKVSNLSAVSEESASAAKVGNEAVEKAITQISNVEKTVTETADMVMNLGERSKNIGAIATTIAHIAGQTNLLSLNAAIEAARAGEQGRGFAVVADEVRKLADQSQKAAKQIAALLSEIRFDIDKVVAAMNIGSQEVKKGAEVVDVAGLSFQSITSLVNKASLQVQEISIAIQETANESHNIVDAITNIEVSSKQTAAQTETVSAATQEQTAAMEEIAASSHNLSYMAEQLQQTIKQFKL